MLLSRIGWLFGWLLALVAHSSLASDWIWSNATPAENETAYFRRSFQIPADIGIGETKLAITADNSYVLFVNGHRIAKGDGEWQSAEVYDIQKLLTVGPNVIAVQAQNAGGPAGLMVDCKLKLVDQLLDLSSGKNWSATTAAQVGWNRASDLMWPAAHVFGPVGQTAPWGAVAIAQQVNIPDSAAQRRATRTPFELRDGDSIIWLGGTFIERAQRYGWLETSLHGALPDRKLRFRNLGWSADTVLAESRGIFDPPTVGYARMLQWVRDIKPSVIVLNYGANESFQGESGLSTFLANYEKLLDDLSATNAELVLMTPHFHLALPAPLPSPEARNRTLAMYGDAIVELAMARHLNVIDLRKLDWKGTQPTRVTDNSLHFNEYGNHVVAQQLPALWLGVETASVRIAQNKAEVAGGHVTGLSAAADTVTFAWKSSTLRAPAQLKLQVSGLKGGNYAVLIDGVAAAKLTNADLAAGRLVQSSTPQVVAAVEALRHKIIEKDTMFFHRWRPQNVTYLFLFRKHEQGNNAQEVDEFEGIVSKLDAEIHPLKQPLTQTVEIRRIGN